ncbi:MAG TPA: PEP-CTERM sorting domain-containing protein [Methylophilaceae bacterium]|jgi:hypothetical protein
MNKYLTIAGSLALMFAVNANAALVVDTGTPDGTGARYVVSDANYLAGQVAFSQALTLNSIETYLKSDLNTAVGAKFTIALYSDNNNQVGDAISSTTATYTGDGWNGAFALNWNVDAGTYWIGIEGYNGGNYIATQKVSSPLANTAYADLTDLGSYTNYPIAFGLRVDAVPEADTYAMLLAGLGIMGVVARRRNA